MSKQRTVDVDKVTAALKRAAAAATTGSRDVRAGKFVAASATKPFPSTKPAANAKPKNK